MARAPHHGPLRLVTKAMSRIAVVVPLSLVLPMGTVHRVADLKPMITVTVGVQRLEVTPSTTFRDMVARLGLAPRAGDLLDVEGAVLERGVYPGRILLNGLSQVSDAPLYDGWRIKVVNGRDRTENLAEEVVKIPGGRPGNPQFFLGTQPGE
ncbi:MAG TPA: hypothetical protein VKA30_12505, partial [Actinomycetota bacterium]|nr:hypothetical protein [Actinomycetota bacterium]